MFSVAGPLIIVHIISDINRPARVLFLFFLFFAIVIAAVRILQDFKTVLMNRIEKGVCYLANDELLQRIMTADGSLFLRANAGRISALVQNFNQSNKIYIQMFMMAITGSVADVAISMTVIGRQIHWLVAVFVLTYGILTIWITLRNNKQTEKYLKVANGRASENANLLGNIVSNIISIRLYQGQSWVSEINRRNNAESCGNWNAFYARKLGYSGIQGLLVLLQYCGAFGALLFLYRETRELSQLLLLVLVLGQLNRPFEVIGTSLRDFAVAKSMAEPMIDLLNDHPPVTRNCTELVEAYTDPDRPPVIEIESLTQGYSDSAPPILDGITAVFVPGCLNFIVGPSGVGKSTLMSILLGLNTKYSGKVCIDNIPLSNFDVATYWSRVGYVPQEPMMMNLSIRENILLGRKYSEDALLDVLDRVGLSSKITNLPNGVDHIIGEGGRLLSAGERQRLSIARALIGQPLILLLDEASSALDGATEAAIIATLRNLAENMTIIAITHRTETISDADHVLELERGLVPEPKLTVTGQAVEC
jgi:ABC-type multidrug transport system fused ATPase/permease subunit